MEDSGETFTINVVVEPSTDEVKRGIHDGLRAFNAPFVGPSPTITFAVFVRDGAGAPVGGLEGSLRWGWLHVENFWLPEALRGLGLGSALLGEAESFARARGCTASCLDTFGFQALPFYEAHGYHVFGIQENYPPGSRRYFLQKSLGDASR